MNPSASRKCMNSSCCLFSQLYCGVKLYRELLIQRSSSPCLPPLSKSLVRTWCLSLKLEKLATLFWDRVRFLAGLQIRTTAAWSPNWVRKYQQHVSEIFAGRCHPALWRVHEWFVKNYGSCQIVFSQENLLGFLTKLFSWFWRISDFFTFLFQIQDFPDKLNFYVMGNVSFFKSMWPEIKGNAAMFVGQLFSSWLNCQQHEESVFKRRKSNMKIKQNQRKPVFFPFQVFY